MSEIQRLKDQNERLLEHIEYLEENLRKSSYYKEGHYAIEAVERGNGGNRLDVKLLM